MLDQQLTNAGGGGSGAADRRPACTAPASTRRPTATRRCSPARPTALAYGAEPAFTVKFTNQGENDEFDIKVTVRISGDSGEPDHAVQDGPEARAAGSSATVELPLDKHAAARRGRDDQGRRSPVPGEKKTDNNKSEYPALFDARLSAAS